MSSFAYHQNAPSKRIRTELVAGFCQDATPASEDACTICSDDYSYWYEADSEDYRGRPIKLSTCGHTFHHGCLLEWTEYGSTCPLCRSEMFPLAAIVSTRRYIVPSESGVRVISESLYREWLSSLGADEVESFQMLSEVRELWVEEILIGKSPACARARARASGGP